MLPSTFGTTGHMGFSVYKGSSVCTMARSKAPSLLSQRVALKTIQEPSLAGEHLDHGSDEELLTEDFSVPSPDEVVLP